MTKDIIKISQEINFNGMPTWVSVGGTLLPDDNVLEGLKSLQKDITEYSKEGNKNKEYHEAVKKESTLAADKEIDKLFKQVKTKLSKYSNRKDAQAYLDTTNFRLNLDLKEIVNNIPE